jgi:hypothetical protein
VQKRLDNATIAGLLAKDKERKPKQPKDVTEPRDYQTWFKLRTTVRENGCENPNCHDPRPKSDYGTGVVYQIKGQFICRYCFLEGYLSERAS